MFCSVVRHSKDLLQNSKEDSATHDNVRPLQKAPFSTISVTALCNATPIPPGSGSNIHPQQIKYIPKVKIFGLTRGINAPRLYGQLDSCSLPFSYGIVLEPCINNKNRFNPGGNSLILCNKLILNELQA